MQLHKNVHMKTNLKWLIAVPLVLLAVLAGIGAMVKYQDPKGYEQQQQKIAKQDSMGQKVIAGDADEVALAKTEAILDKQGLSLCQVYQWINDSEDEIRRKMEVKHGIPTAMKMSEQRSAAYDKAWTEYRKQHNIPDSLRSYINVFGVSNCQ